MVGFNMANPSAAEFAIPKASAAGMGVIGMFAVRGLLGQSEEMTRIAREAGIGSLSELAYRYCRHQAGKRQTKSDGHSRQHADYLWAISRESKPGDARGNDRPAAHQHMKPGCRAKQRERQIPTVDDQRCETAENQGVRKALCLHATDDPFARHVQSMAENDKQAGAQNAGERKRDDSRTQ